MKMIECCRLEDVPPHVYSIAQAAYESLIKTGQSQSIIFTGHSGSGKTTNACHILKYFCHTTALQPYHQKLCKYFVMLYVVFIIHNYNMCYSTCYSC